MSPRLAVLLGLLAACAAPEPVTPKPPPSAPAPIWVGLEEAPSTLAPVRFRADAERPVVISQLESRTTVSGPIAWTELSIKLTNLGVADAAGTLELDLSGSTTAALEVPSQGDPLALAELRGPTRPGARTFRTRRRTIPGNDSVTVVLRHAMITGGPERSARLLLGGLGPLERARVVVSELGAAVPISDQDLAGAPLADVIVRGQSAREARGGGLRLSREEVPRAGKPAAPIRGLVLLLDTSAARAHDLQAQARLARDLSAALAPDAPVVVAAHDLEPVLLFEGRAADTPRDLALELKQRGALGASQTEGALAWAIDKAGSAYDRVVLVSDGIDGLAAVDPAGLASRLRERARGSDLRIDVVTPSGAQSSPHLVALARDVAPRRGRLAALHGSPASVVGAPDGAPAQPRLWAWPAPPDVAPEGAELVVAALDGSPAASGAVPAWTLAAIAAAPARAAKPFDRVAALMKSARPFYGSEVDRQELDPLSALEERKKATKESAQPTVEVTPAPAAEGEPPKATKGTLPPQSIQDIVRKNLGKARACYQDALRRVPQAKGRIVVRFSITPEGPVSLARALSSEVDDAKLVACVVRAFEELAFPASDREPIVVTYPLVLEKSASKDAAPLASGNPVLKPSRVPPPKAPKEPWLDDLRPIYEASLRGDHAVAAELAKQKVAAQPDRALGYLALGDALLSAGRGAEATRAYASILDLDATDSSPLRLAAGRLAAAGTPLGAALAEEALLFAVELSPEEPHALAAVASLRAEAGRLEEALVLLDLALARATDPTKHPGLRDAVRADLGMFAAALVVKQDVKKVRVERWLADVGAKLAGPSLRALLSWEGDADVDLVVRDAGLSIASKVTPALPTGGRLIGDALKGPAAEAFVLEAPPSSRSAPYTFSAALASSLTAYATGTLELVELSPSDKLSFSRRPVLVQVPGAEVTALTLER